MIIVVFLCGLFIGSFLNVCIYKIPRNIMIFKRFFYCPRCNNQLYWKDVIPVLSYIFLKGRCPYCRLKISIKYPIVELINAFAYVWLYCIYGISITFWSMAFLTSMLIVIGFINFTHSVIPSKILIFIFIVGIIFNLINKNLTLLDSFIGLIIVSIPLVILSYFTHGDIGGGDIKLMAVTGFFLGWKCIFFSILVAAIIGSFTAVVLILLKKKTWKDTLHFVPFLCIGMFVTMLYGQQIMNLYISVFN